MIRPNSRRAFLIQCAGSFAGLLASTGMAHSRRVLAGASAARRLDRQNLLVYRDPTGEIRPVQSIGDWQKRRSEIVRGMEEIMGPFPGEAKRCPLEPRVEEEADCGTYVRRLLTYAAEPGSRVPAYLLIPKRVLERDEHAPAILCLHPTDHQIGHKVVAGLGGRPNRQYAQELAGRGYVTLAPSYPLLANYQPDIQTLGYESGTMKAIWDNVRGLDLLESLPFVKRGAFGAIGHSLGGHNAVYTAVLEERIRVIISSCGLDSYLDYYRENPAVWEAGKGWTQLRYMPRLAGFAGRLQEIPFDFHELIGALAPRPCFISAPLGDTNFKWQSVAAIAKAAAPVYELYAAAANLQVEHPDCGHDFPDEMREKAYALFDRVLAP